jgi:hypothetical protein
VVLDDLLKVKDGFILNLLKLFGHFRIDHLVVQMSVIQILPREYLADVEVCLDLCHIISHDMLEVDHGLLVHLYMEVGEASL